MSFLTKFFTGAPAAQPQQQQQQQGGKLDAAQLSADNPRGEPSPSSSSSVATVAEEERKSTLLSLLSTSLGMDVTSGFSVPVYFCEPSSNLTRMAEMFEYEEILKESVNMSSIERLACVSLFVISGLSNCQRYLKPLNPLLGETFEYVDPRGFKFFAEQISHHPPISASHCESKEFTFWQQAHVKTKFMGNTLELYPNSKASLFFHESGDFFSFTPPLSKLHNLIIGSTWIEFYGECKIENLTTGDVCTLNVDPAGWFGSYSYGFNGVCKTKSGLECIKLGGKWSEGGEANWISQVAKEAYLKEAPIRNPLPVDQFPDTIKAIAEKIAGTPPAPHNNICDALLVKRWSVYPNNFAYPFSMSKFAHHLCEVKCPDQCLISTDCRLRPDRRALELAIKERAVYYKSFLEEEQRKDRRELEAQLGKDAKWEPVWFKPISEDYYVYNGNYWEQSEQAFNKNKKAEEESKENPNFEIFCPKQNKGKAMDFLRYGFHPNQPAKK
eukprot:TRINITY_DN22605_c0_g1_i1.p1 TRINITY_DN22605_c0_g1~~TRINITY_DN22605_c0_g1_i1.p1  ORF type:complete len:505 (+),score=165.49 TRINITY_DN22605_c0_g1_i1:22-1515(+)